LTGLARLAHCHSPAPAPQPGLRQDAAGTSAVGNSIFNPDLQSGSPGLDDMYAIIETGGKQYRVAEGDTLRVEKLTAETGAAVDLDKVLLLADGDDVRLGKPYLEGTRVTAEVAGHGRGDKVRIVKFRRRKHHLKRQGHRQWFTELKITGISAG
jgi:large subunit ribosomal protein L21